MIETQSIQSDVYDVGGKIRQYRQARKLSQESLAAETGITSKTVSRAEVGDTSLSVGGFFKVCDVLGVTPNDLAPERFQRKGEKADGSDDFIRIYSSLSEENRQMLFKMANALATQERMTID